MRRFENCAVRCARGIAQLPATPYPPSMEQIAQGEKITRLRHPAPSTCRSDPTFLVFESNTTEPNNSIEDGANATKDLISVPLMTRKVRLQNEQYCVSDVGANVSNTRHQSVMVARAPCSPSSQIRPDTRCVHNETSVRAARAHGSPELD